MNPKMSRLYATYNEELSKESWTNYLGLLRQLCQAYSHIDFVRELHGLIRGKNWRGLYELADSLSSQKYEDATEHFVANQFSALIRKYPFPPGLDLGLDPEKIGKQRFWKSEQKCRRINSRFKAYGSCRSPFESYLHAARGWIAYVLGDFDLAAVTQECWFGPGANVGVSGNATNFARKLLSDRWSCTPGAASYGFGAFVRNPHLLEFLLREEGKPFVCFDLDRAYERYMSKLSVVQHNKIAFVPKSAKTHRVIAVEPLINSFLQKGVDRYMKKRMLRVGIDLREQGINQQLAQRGSMDDSEESFVTIDLSMASDSLSTEVVRYLLPPDWFAYLNAIRSEQFLLDGNLHPFHKFCSMGNGFCFPLETLIFASLCFAAGCGACGHDFVTYGDDIIVRKSHSDLVIRLLGVCGFKTNSDKTFLSGPFRESCGSDWFNGIDVRPMTLDFALDSVQSLFKFHNLTLRNARTSEFFSELRPLIRELAPTDFRFVRTLTGPEDSAFQVEQDVFLASPHVRWSRDLQAWDWRELLASSTIDRRVRRHSQYSDVLIIAALSGSHSSAPFSVRYQPETKVRRKLRTATRK